MDYVYILFALALFIAVVLLLEGLYMSWNAKHGPEARRIARRLAAMSSETADDMAHVSILKHRVLSDTPAIHRVLNVVPKIGTLDALLQQAGLVINVSQFLLASFACILGAFVLLELLSTPAMVAIVLALCGGAVPYLVVNTMKRKRLAKIEEQLPEALDLISRALRAGHSFSSTLKMVGDDLPDPLATEFKIVFDEVNYGIPMQDALKNLSVRVPGTDVGYFVVAVMIQRETGGNLAELLDKIATIVRERLKLFGQIRVYAAEGVMSAWILFALPIALALILNLLSPGFMEVFWVDATAQKVLGIMTVLMIIGAIWMRKIIRIRV